MKDRDYLIWLLQRLHHIHGENLTRVHMSKLASIIDRIHPDQYSPDIAGPSRTAELAGTPPKGRLKDYGWADTIPERLL